MSTPPSGPSRRAANSYVSPVPSSYVSVRPVGDVTPSRFAAPAAYRATFEVERVWRGSVTRHFDLYVWEHATETPRFELDDEYVVFAHGNCDDV